MKKVVFVSNVIGNGGAGRVMAIIADYFVEKGIDVTLCSFLDNYETYEINPKVKQAIIKKDFKGLFGKIQRILKLRKFIKKHQDATIIAFEYFVNMEAIVATCGLKNRIIVSERNSPDILDKRKNLKILRDILYRYTDVLVCQTAEAKEYFSEYIQGKTVIIPNPIKSDLPYYEGIRKKEITTFCRVEKQKNLKMLIDAFEMLLKDHKEYVLSIYGDGSEKKDLIEYVGAKGLEKKVIFYPFDMDIHDKIVDCEMYVSTSDFEGLSNSMLEAMGMGMPVVCTDCKGGGARMIIKNGINGILVPVKDTVAFYQGMKYLLDNKDKAREIGKNAMSVKDDLSVDNICRRWMDLI